MTDITNVKTLKSTEEIGALKKEAIELINQCDHGKFIVIVEIDHRTVVQSGNFSLDSAIAQCCYAKHLMVHDSLMIMSGAQ